MELIDRAVIRNALMETGQSNPKFKMGEVWHLTAEEILSVVNSVPEVKGQDLIDEALKQNGYALCDNCYGGR